MDVGIEKTLYKHKIDTLQSFLSSEKHDLHIK